MTRSVEVPTTSPSPPRWGQATALGAAFPVALGVVAVPTVGIAAWRALGGTTAVLTAVVLLGWLGVTAAVSRTRAYQRSARPGVLLVVVPVVVVSVALARSGSPSELLAVTPVGWPIEFQAYRIVGGVFLLAWLSGEMRRPGFGVWAGGVDLVIGFTSLPVAWWVAADAPGATTVGVVWNLIGLTDFVVALVVVGADRTVIRDLFGPSGPAVSALRPIVLVIFSFAVPMMSIVHVLSIRQLLG